MNRFEHDRFDPTNVNSSGEREGFIRGPPKHPSSSMDFECDRRPTPRTRASPPPPPPLWHRPMNRSTTLSDSNEHGGRRAPPTLVGSATPTPLLGPRAHDVHVPVRGGGSGLLLELSEGLCQRTLQEDELGDGVAEADARHRSRRRRTTCASHRGVSRGGMGWRVAWRGSNTTENWGVWGHRRAIRPSSGSMTS
jgi:hypothetical protein